MKLETVLSYAYKGKLTPYFVRMEETSDGSKERGLSYPRPAREEPLRTGRRHAQALVGGEVLFYTVLSAWREGHRW